MKIPVFCSLIPAELIKHCGHEPHYVEASDLIASRAGAYHCFFHDNLCSYSKSLFDYLVKKQGEFGLIVVPASCDAMKKLYNALSCEVPEEKLFLLDVPQIKGDGAPKYMGKELQRLECQMRG